MLDRGRAAHPSQALLVGLEAARGLDYAHRRGFVHRDIKPANLLFARTGACASPTSAWPGRSPRRRGPSRWARCSAPPATRRPSRRGAWRVDGKSDVYSLALVLVEAVTGRCRSPPTPPSPRSWPTSIVRSRCPTSAASWRARCAGPVPTIPTSGPTPPSSVPRSRAPPHRSTVPRAAAPGRGAAARRRARRRSRSDRAHAASGGRGGGDGRGGGGGDRRRCGGGRCGGGRWGAARTHDAADVEGPDRLGRRRARRRVGADGRRSRRRRCPRRVRHGRVERRGTTGTPRTGDAGLGRGDRARRRAGRVGGRQRTRGQGTLAPHAATHRGRSMSRRCRSCSTIRPVRSPGRP